MELERRTEAQDLRWIAGELLRLQLRQDEWIEDVESSKHIRIEEPISGNWELLHLALDILGEPIDNSLGEIDACELATKTGEWPEWAHCRDGIVDMYQIVAKKWNDIDTFMEIVTGEIEIPYDGFATDNQLHMFLYGSPAKCE